MIARAWVIGSTAAEVSRVQPNGTLVTAGGLCAVIGLVWLAAVAARNQPRRPERGPATMHLLDDSPAVVDLITNPALEVTQEAAVATLVDLGARRWVLLERAPDGTGQCRTRERDGLGALSPIEQQLLRHVRLRATNGLVPLAALTTGDEMASEQWWKEFRRQVIGAARSAGYVRKRWQGSHLVPSWLALFAAGGLLYGSIATVGEDSELTPTVALGVAVAATIALGVLAARLGTSKALRDTDAGRARAGEWLGVQSFLADHGQFEDQPPAAVTLWNRYLAYAIALGLGRQALREVPLGAEDDHRAWSTASGSWRQVRVRYPRFLPGWGRHPATALALGVLWGGLSYTLCDFGVWAASEQFRDSFDWTNPSPLATRVVSTFGVVLIGLGVIGLLWSAAQFIGGLVDVLARTQVEGQVVRARQRSRRIPEPPKVVRWAMGRRDLETPERLWHYLAVDAGDDRDVTAWRVPRRAYHLVEQGQWVRVKLTRVLRRVLELEIIAPPTGPEPVATSAGFDPSTADAQLRELAAEAASMNAATAAATEPR